MNKIVLTLLLGFITIHFLKAQNNTPSEQLRRHNALNYIVKPSGIYKRGNIIIADTSELFNNITYFSKEISALWKQEEKQTILILDSLERLGNSHQPKTLSPVPKPLNKSVSAAQNVLCFTKAYQNLMIAEIFPNQYNTLITQRPLFGQGILYLFIFNKEDKITQVYKKIITYN